MLRENLTLEESLVANDEGVPPREPLEHPLPFAHARPGGGRLQLDGVHEPLGERGVRRLLSRVDTGVVVGVVGPDRFRGGRGGRRQAAGA